jgi:hypothetical protein
MRECIAFQLSTMFVTICRPLLVGFVMCSGCELASASGLFVGMGEPTTSVNISPGGHASVILTLKNEDALAIDLFVAQVVVTTQSSGSPGDAGGVSFASATGVSDAVFDLPTPLVIPWDGGTLIQTATLADPTTLLAGETRALFQLDFQASPDARGTHYLYMKPYVSEDFNSSGVLALFEDLLHIPYENAASPEHAGLVLLATFEIDEPVSGDYDGDGVVGAEDYVIWKTLYGRTVDVPGSEADGNNDGFIDLADYTVWRDNLGTGGPPAPMAALPHAPVPEAPTGLMASLACVVGVLTGSAINSRNSRSVIGRAGRCE